MPEKSALKSSSMFMAVYLPAASVCCLDAIVSDPAGSFVPSERSTGHCPRIWPDIIFGNPENPERDYATHGSRGRKGRAAPRDLLALR